MKPWREVAIPHRDVLEGTFRQSEFAADISAVRNGKAPLEYQDPVAFFERTFITEGMELLLGQVIQRLSGKGGEPVIQLQTAFGGGKTHTILAVYHLANRNVPLSELAGIPSLMDRIGALDIPEANVAALDGNNHAPGQPWKNGNRPIRTLWGELAWQLGGEEAYTLVRESDESGTSPGKEMLRTLLDRHAPCVVLIDELVAYFRQFPEGVALSGGTYDSNLSFVQALTEAAKLVPTAVVLASLPESDVEAGSSHQGVAALRALEHLFGRVQALWKPVATHEAFEIVRRRLFEKIQDVKTKESVCQAFADLYRREVSNLPTETQEARYLDKLVNAYPIHPEVFERLYGDWSTIEGFQRTRGVLKLMAKVIHKLWKDQNKDFLIMPGSLPLYDKDTRNEFIYYLPTGWDPVIDRDIDGDQAETTDLESREPIFGQVNAARRVARTLFLATAPASVVNTATHRGIGKASAVLGCLQPGQTSSVFSDALGKLADRLHYLNSAGDRSLDNAEYWFDTRANLRREMEDRKHRFERNGADIAKLGKVLGQVVTPNGIFDGVHVFVPHKDVPDNEFLRLVVLPPQYAYQKDIRPQPTAFAEADSYLKNNGTSPRYKANRLLFLAADQKTVSRTLDTIRVALAWESIVEDVKTGRLIIDTSQAQGAVNEWNRSEHALPQAVRDCYKWLLCPLQEDPASRGWIMEAFVLGTVSGSVTQAIEQVTRENELIISAWAAPHLSKLLMDLYWKGDRKAVKAMSFWEDSLKYLYLPRLRRKEVLAEAIRIGAQTRDFFGIAYGETDGEYQGFKFGTDVVQLDDTLLLIEPQAAKEYEEAHKPKQPEPPVVPLPGQGGGRVGGGAAGGGDGTPPIVTPPEGQKKFHFFHGNVKVSPMLAKAKMMEIADEIISHLCKDPNGTVEVTVEISATFPHGVAEDVKRTVSENGSVLKVDGNWE
jgi:hypothetical protein